MHFSLPVFLGVGILASFGAATNLPPEGPEWVADIKTHIEEHEADLSSPQIEALNDALVLAVTRDEKLAPQMKAKMIEAFGKDETAKLLTSRWPVCSCILDHNMCIEPKQCAVGGCVSGNTQCLPDDPVENGPCTGTCV